MEPNRRAGHFVWIASGLLLSVVLAASLIEYASWLRSGLVAIPGDLDPYIRLVRIQQLLEGAGWRDSTIPGAHLGASEYLAWTRPLDVLILAVSWPLRLGLSDDTALLLGGSLTSPLLLVACVPFLVASARAIGIETFGVVCVVLAFACHPAILPDFRFGRADHHALLMLCAIAFVACFLRALDSARRRNLVWAGAVCGFGIWVNPEFALFPALAIAFLALSWCLGDRRSALGVAALSVGALALVAIAAISEAGLPGVWAVEHDRASSVHLALLSTAAGVGVAMELMGRRVSARSARVLFAAAVGALSWLTLDHFYPGFYLGPARAMDPQLREVWFERLAQSQSLFDTDVPDGRDYAIATLLALAYAVPTLAYFRSRAEPRKRRRLDFLLLSVVGCFAVTLGFRRGAASVALLSALPLGLLGDALNRRASARTAPASNQPTELLRGVAVKSFAIVCALAPHLALSAAHAIERAPEPVAEGRSAARAECQRELHRWIQEDRIAAQSGMDRALVVTRAGDAPALLYWTDHRVLAWNHHRSADGLVLLDRFFRARNEREWRAAVSAADADLVLYCAGSGDLEPYWSRGDAPPRPAGAKWLSGGPGETGPRLLEIPRDPSS